MFTGKFILTIFVIAIAITFIQWFFIGFAFHKYQSQTPATWRKESSRSYAASMILSLFFAFMFTTVFYFWKNTRAGMNLLDGIEFGSVCWLTFSITKEIESAVYINFSGMFTIGKCLSSLVEYAVAGLAAAWLL
jgi:hypothetical protein